MAGVPATDDLGPAAQLGEHPGPDGDVAAPLGAGRDRDRARDLRHLLAKSLRGQTGVAGCGRQARQHGGAGALQPGVAVLRQTRGDHVLDHALPLGLRNPRGRTPPGRREQVTREDEERAAHGELLDQGAIVVERLSTSATVSPSVRANSERWTVAGSVEWSTVIARVADSGPSARRAGAMPWRRAMRCRR